LWTESESFQYTIDPLRICLDYDEPFHDFSGAFGADALRSTARSGQASQEVEAARVDEEM